MVDSSTILAALDRINAQRHGSFAVVSADDGRDYYAQFLADGDSGLYVEVVGDGFLAPADRLTAVQASEMRVRGWKTAPGENWSKAWADASTPEARQQIALDTLGALHEVYGARGDVQVEVHLEGAGAKQALVSSSGAGAAPAPAALLAVAIVITMLFGLGAALLIFFL